MDLWYSADDFNTWSCENCGAEIKSKFIQASIKDTPQTYPIIICPKNSFHTNTFGPIPGLAHIGVALIPQLFKRKVNMIQMKNYYSLQLQHSIHQQRLESMIQKYGSQHPKVLLQSQKVNKIFVQMQMDNSKHSSYALQDNVPRSTT